MKISPRVRTNLKSRAYRLVSYRTEQENQRRRVKPLHRPTAHEDTRSSRNRLGKAVPSFLYGDLDEGERHEARRTEIQHHHYQPATLHRTLPEVTRVEIGRTEESTVARYIATEFDAQEFKDLT